MAVHINNVTFDCADARALAEFWQVVTGWELFYDDDPEVLLGPSYPYDGTGFLFIPVPEGKTAKNRVHLDLAPDDTTRDDLVDRALAAGASVLGDFRADDGSGFVAMQDPEGNEFCIERGRHEVGPRRPRAIRLTM
ncbi:VOC family protein [Nocardioides taihuensis]|uniref:VOC family protein n=1 Tax=Nocardioides taihuensis TaxID=1835606 RepID=A0ABW0BGT6_9ACTN